MTDLVHWFHVFADGPNWHEPVEEHMQALARGRFTGRFKVGIVGAPEPRAEALAVIGAQRPPDHVAHFDTGWEQPTLRLLRADAKRRRDGITLYCHSKGAANGDPRQQGAWRRSMTCALLGNLSANIAALETHDAVGSHWLDPLPSGGRGFGGNFWLARNSFLASLAAVPAENRHQAESWIGSGPQAPRVLDLCPGYPGSVPWVRGIGWPR